MLSETLISVPHVSHTLNYSAEKPAAEREERRRKEKRKDLRASLFCSCSTHPPSRLSVPDPVWRGGADGSYWGTRSCVTRASALISKAFILHFLLLASVNQARWTVTNSCLRGQTSVERPQKVAACIRTQMGSIKETSKKTRNEPF